MKWTLTICLLTLFSLQSLSQNKPQIIEKPIKYNTERVDLSLNYLQERYGIVQLIPTITPKVIVIHWTGSNSLTAAFRTFENPRLANNRPELRKAGPLNVSAHYLVDRDGTIYHLMADTLFARHTIGLNHCAIGIENVGGPQYQLTKAQLKANADLVTYLAAKYPINYLIGHYESHCLKGTSLWKEKDITYHTEKYDPGRNFMRNLREELKVLSLKGACN
jgi:N-acetylmuramoyl-L-alanine amidase